MTGETPDTPASASPTPVLAPAGYDRLNVYTTIIVDEALARGIEVQVQDPDRGELLLRWQDRTVTTVESLSELTSELAFQRCDDKLLTREVLEAAGLRVAPGRRVTDDAEDLAFLGFHQQIVVKPVRGEQGWGVSVGVDTEEWLARAITEARRFSPAVLMEKRCLGDDLRLVVIGGDVVAASVRRPASVTGDGQRTVTELVEAANQVLEVGQVPLDDSTTATVRANGHEPDEVLGVGVEVVVAGTANVHTGGSIHDVTDEIHPGLAEAAVAAAAAIDIPVTGIDMIVTSLKDDEYHIIEANEQPGLANHEPRPTAARFIDLLFPETSS